MIGPADSDRNCTCITRAARMSAPRRRAGTNARSSMEGAQTDVCCNSADLHEVAELARQNRVESFAYGRHAGDAAGSRASCFGDSITADVNGAEANVAIYLDSPSTTSSITYKVQGVTETGTFYVNRTPNDGDTIEIGIRPEDLVVSKKGGVPMSVDVVEHVGATVILYGSVLDNGNFCAVLPSDSDIKPGDKINLAIDPKKCHAFNSLGQALKRI